VLALPALNGNSTLQSRMRELHPLTLLALAVRSRYRWVHCFQQQVPVAEGCSCENGGMRLMRVAEED
jgi:hypothetical protein